MASPWQGDRLSFAASAASSPTPPASTCAWPKTPSPASPAAPASIWKTWSCGKTPWRATPTRFSCPPVARASGPCTILTYHGLAARDTGGTPVLRQRDTDVLPHVQQSLSPPDGAQRHHRIFYPRRVHQLLPRSA